MTRKLVEVEIAKLIFPSSRPFADPNKLARHGRFDMAIYQPIEVEVAQYGKYVVQSGVTRVENARNAGITKLLAYVHS